MAAAAAVHWRFDADAHRSGGARGAHFPGRDIYMGALLELLRTGEYAV